MKKDLARKGFVLMMILAFSLLVTPCFAANATGASFNVVGKEHPGFAGQPAGNKMIGKVLWQGLKPFAFVANVLDSLFKGNYSVAAKQAVTAPVNYAVSVAADTATMAVGDTKVYAGPDNQALKLP